jgi:uncharacterized protein YjbI with pentapeptide repeats
MNSQLTSSHIVLRISAIVFLLVAFATAARADIFRWEYINSADPSQGKRQSTTLAPHGAGVDAVPGAPLYSRNLEMAYLIGADLTNANASFANLTDADLNQANLTNADFVVVTLTGADFTNASVQGASFDVYWNCGTSCLRVGTGISLDQLYSTASYQLRDLRGIGLGDHNLAGANFTGQNLTNADFSYATLTGANFRQADLTNASFQNTGLTGADFTGAQVREANFSGITLAQLYSTASYQTRDLTGIGLSGDLSGGNFSSQNLTNAGVTGILTGANFREANLTNANFGSVTLTDANFSQANLTNANFGSVTLTGADFTGAEVRGANFSLRFDYNTNMYVGGLTLAQLYSTASYQAHDLSAIGLANNNLIGGNFADQKLTNADLSDTTLTGADFTGAEIRGANFRYATGFTAAQLYSTASYKAHDLTGIDLGGSNLAGANFVGQNLANAAFYYGTLTGADFTAADARGALFHSSNPITGATTTNLILPDGHINGLNLNSDRLLEVRDYNGNAIYGVGPISITIDQRLAMGPGGTLRMVFEADAWDSTISFAPGIPVTLGGTLELTFAADVNLASQVGRTFDLFDWTGVNPTGAFAVSSPYTWDLSNLYATGEVTLTAVPEPSAILLLGISLVASVSTHRICLRHPTRVLQLAVSAWLIITWANAVHADIFRGIRIQRTGQ